MEKKLLLLVFTLVLFAGPALAQSYNDEAKEDLESLKPGTTNFLLRGYSHAGFQSIDGNSSFVSGQYAPILMWNSKLNLRAMVFSLPWSMLIYHTS